MSASEGSAGTVNAGCDEITVGQWRRDDFTFVVLAVPDDGGWVHCEVRYRGVGAPKPKKVCMPASRVRRAEIVDAF